MYSPFLGIHRLLFLDCKTAPSNIDIGIFSATPGDIHMLSLGLCDAFRQVPHIRLSYFPQKELIPSNAAYDALMSARIFWQINADEISKSPRHQFDLIVELRLHTRNEHNQIQTNHLYITALHREGFVIGNQLFFCRLTNDLPTSIMMPKLTESIHALTQLPTDIAVTSPDFDDHKSKALFEAKAYASLKRYIVASRLSKNNDKAISLFMDARLTDAIEVLNDKNRISYKSYTQKYHTQFYALGLCFEKTGHIKKALSCYRMVVKYAPDCSRYCASGIARCLNILAVRDHMHLARINIGPDTAFILEKKQVKRLRHQKQNISVTEDSSKQTQQYPIVENIPIQETIDSYDSSEKIAIQMMLDQWMSAWRSQNSAEYFQFYASNFEPESQMSYSQWKQNRIERLKRKSIFVSIVGEADITFISDSSAIVLIEQDYESKGFYYKDRTQKRLHVIKINGHWKIQKEEVLGVVP